MDLNVCSESMSQDPDTGGVFHVEIMEDHKDEAFPYCIHSPKAKDENAVKSKRRSFLEYKLAGKVFRRSRSVDSDNLQDSHSVYKKASEEEHKDPHSVYKKASEEEHKDSVQSGEGALGVTSVSAHKTSVVSELLRVSGRSTHYRWRDYSTLCYGVMYLTRDVPEESNNQVGTNLWVSIMIFFSLFFSAIVITV